MKNILITFDSTNYAIQCETVLKEKRIKGQIMPTPREITKSCGISIRVEYEELEKIKELINDRKIKVKMLYSFGEERIFEPIL